MAEAVAGLLRIDLSDELVFERVLFETELILVLRTKRQAECCHVLGEGSFNFRVDMLLWLAHIGRDTNESCRFTNKLHI